MCPSLCLHKKFLKNFIKKPLKTLFKVFLINVKKIIQKELVVFFFFRLHIRLRMKIKNAEIPSIKLIDFADKSLLILDDDDPFRSRLARAMEKKGFVVTEAKNVEEGLKIAQNKPTSFAVIDLRLEDGSGLEVIKTLHKSKKESRIVMLTGYGNLPTAVAAVKAGAIDYIAKPVDADDVEAALLASPESKAKPPENPMSADRVKWEHIHRVFELCNRNVSETARRLKMHRRTLQRILSKRSPK